MEGTNLVTLEVLKHLSGSGPCGDFHEQSVLVTLFGHPVAGVKPSDDCANWSSAFESHPARQLTVIMPRGLTLPVAFPNDLATEQSAVCMPGDDSTSERG